MSIFSDNYLAKYLIITTGLINLFCRSFIMLQKITKIRYCIPAKNMFRYSSTSDSLMILYGDEAAPPVRFIQMTASLLNIPYKMEKIDLFKSENKNETYQKEMKDLMLKHFPPVNQKDVNPLRKVPTLTDGTRTIIDSHAIALYLCENYNGQSLYPYDPEIRSKIQQMLFFNCSTLFPIDSAIFTNYFALQNHKNKKLEQDWTKALRYLEYKLEQFKWLAGDKMTLCDLCCGATVSSLQLLVPPTEDHNNVNLWMSRLQGLPCYEINEKGLQRLKGFIEVVKQATINF